MFQRASSGVRNVWLSQSLSGLINVWVSFDFQTVSAKVVWGVFEVIIFAPVWILLYKDKNEGTQHVSKEWRAAAPWSLWSVFGAWVPVEKHD